MNWGVVMAKKKRTNPHKRLASSKNIEDAKQEATGNGIEAALLVMFSVLHDKHGWGRKRMNAFFDRLNELSGDVACRKVSILELEDTLRKKYGVVVSNDRIKRDRPIGRATLADLKRAQRKATEDGLMASLICAFTVLSEKGWGKVRLQRLKQQVAFQFDCVRERYVSFADLRKMLQDECKVELVC